MFSLNAFGFDSLLFKPLTANPLEARIGSLYQFDSDRLRLDIGHSLDMLSVYEGDSADIRIGGDFFILSRLRSEGKFKFPVETADYYFGLNSTGALQSGEYIWSYRVRIAHISSHLIDGYTKDNEFLQAPFVYSREFVDVVAALSWKGLRVYGGVNCIFSTLPKDVNHFVPQLGLDYETKLIGNLSVSGGYDWKLVGTDDAADVGCNAVQCGLIYYLSKNVGVALNYYYYGGYSIHGMFYDKRENYNGIGVQIVY
jgi:hypothetical protein